VLHPERAYDDWRGPTTYQRYQVYAAVCSLKGMQPKPFQYASHMADPRAAVLNSLGALARGMGMDLQPVLAASPERASVARPPAAQTRDARSSVRTERPLARAQSALSSNSAVLARPSTMQPIIAARARPVVVHHPTLLRVPLPIRRARPLSDAPRAHHVPQPSSVHVAASATSAAPRVVRAAEMSRAPRVVPQPAVRSGHVAAHRADMLSEEEKRLSEGADAADAAVSCSSDDAASAAAEPAAVPMGFAWGWSSMYGTSLWEETRVRILASPLDNISM
jgi:hypothetical protein